MLFNDISRYFEANFELSLLCYFFPGRCFKHPIWSCDPRSNIWGNYIHSETLIQRIQNNFSETDNSISSLGQQQEPRRWTSFSMRETLCLVLLTRSIFPLHSLFVTRAQSHKNPVSASAMLTGKFLQIRKVFGTSSLLAEEFPDTLQYKISR